MRSTWSLLLSRLNNHSFLSYSSIRLMTSFVFPSTVLPNNPACRPLCTQQLQRSSCQVASWLLLPRFWCRTLRVLATPRIHLKKKKKIHSCTQRSLTLMEVLLKEENQGLNVEHQSLRKKDKAYTSSLMERMLKVSCAGNLLLSQW